MPEIYTQFMPYEQITYEVSNLVATVTLNRPDKLNAWTQKMEQEAPAPLTTTTHTHSPIMRGLVHGENARKTKLTDRGTGMRGRERRTR